MLEFVRVFCSFFGESMLICALNEDFLLCDSCFCGAHKDAQLAWLCMLESKHKTLPNFVLKELESAHLKRITEHKNLLSHADFIASQILHTQTRFLRDSYPCVARSHSGGIAAILYAQKAVGVDIECIRERDFTAHLELCCSAYERELIAQSKNPLVEFYRIWTLKEAVLKLCGLDLSFVRNVCLTQKGIFVKGKAVKEVKFGHLQMCFSNISVMVSLATLRD